MHMRMEVDRASTSPSFFATRRMSTKRARSPDDANERASKRVARHEGNFMPHIATTSAGIRYASDDWVRQAGTLRLNSPHTPETQFISQQPEQQCHSMDMDMTTPHHLISAQNTHQHHLNVPQHVPTAQHEHQAPHSPFAVQTQPEHSRIATDPFSPPDLPMHAPVPQHNDTQSIVTLPSQGSTSKKRFTMGPRTDCDKCRLGVKGHYMHFD